MEEFFRKLTEMSQKTNGGVFINQMNIVVENRGTVNNRTNETVCKDRHAHFPPCIDENRGIALYRFLIQRGMIEATADEASFLYLMGCVADSPTNVKRIEWLANKQLLREMLEGASRLLLEGGNFKKSDIERLAPLCFTQDGKPLNLAKSKPVPSIDSDALENFFATW